MGGFWRHKQVELLRPDDKRLHRLPAFLLAPCAFEPVQHLVASIHSWTKLVLPQERDRVGQRANDAPIAHADLRHKANVGRVSHGPVNHPDR
jgi:hypothetical protein